MLDAAFAKSEARMATYNKDACDVDCGLEACSASAEAKVNAAKIIVVFPRFRDCQSHGASFDGDCCECTKVHCKSCVSCPHGFCTAHRKSRHSKRLRDELCKHYGVTCS